MTDRNQTSQSFEVSGHQLADKIRELLAAGNVRTVSIRSENGEVYLSVPLTAGALIGGAFVLAAPWLALVAAISGLLAKVQVEVTYDGPEADQSEGGKE